MLLKKYPIVFFIACFCTAYVRLSAQELMPDPAANSQIIYFNGTGEDNGNIISWSTVTEANTVYFSVERSCDHILWEEAFKLKGEGRSTQQIPYSWRDESPYPGFTYYRIKVVYNNDSVSYSKSIVVESKLQVSVEIYPNPTDGLIRLTVLGKENESSHLYIKNMMDQVLFSAEINNNSPMEIDVEAFPEGIYAVDVESKNGSSVQRLIKR
jgi:hypothetical protein